MRKPGTRFCRGVRLLPLQPFSCDPIPPGCLSTQQSPILTISICSGPSLSRVPPGSHHLPPLTHFSPFPVNLHGGDASSSPVAPPPTPRHFLPHPLDILPLMAIAPHFPLLSHISGPDPKMLVFSRIVTQALLSSYCTLALRGGVHALAQMTVYQVYQPALH